MAPTIQSPADRDKRQRPAEKKSELVCRVKYCNTLPDIPFDPKFITYPFESNRFVQYNPTSLERQYRHDLLTEHDLGVTIDLINSETYAINESACLDPQDERLLEEDIITPQDSKRSRHHSKSVSWLRRTEYISTEYTRFQPSSDKTETKVGYNVKRFFKEQDLYMDRDSQIKAIDKTFDDAKLPLEKHHTKSHVTPVEVFQVFPDFEMWKYPCAQVIFDSDPAPIGRPLPAQLEEMSQAMIRGVMDESGEQFVAYFLPTEETIVKRKIDVDEKVDYKDEEEYEYKMAREYNWNVKNKASKGYEENYFFVFRESGVFYNELETRVRLSKRRLKPGAQPNNSRLVVRHRPLNEMEFKTQEVRMMQLEEQQEEEEEEPQKEAEPEEEEGNMEVDDENNKDGGGDDDDDEDGGGEDRGEEKKRQKKNVINDDSDIEDEDEGKKATPVAGSESDNDEASGKSEKSASESEAEEDEKAASEKEDGGKDDEDEDQDGDRRNREREATENSGDEKSENSSNKSDSSSESGGSGSESESQSEAEEEEANQKKRDEEEIFGSESESD